MMLGMLAAATFLACGCSGDRPSDAEIRAAIEESLRRAVPLDLLEWKTASKAVSIEEIRIIEISETLQGDTPVGKVPYWMVWAHVKGKCRDVFETREEEFPFEGRAKYWVFVEERSGKLVADKDKIF
jgi:hypothetical protein